MTAVPGQTHRFVRFGIIAIYAVAVQWIAVRAGNPTDLWWWLGEIPFFLWIMAPIAVPLLLRLRHWLLTVAVAAMAAYSVYIYEQDMFGPGARSTSALIFIFLPLYQWAATFVLIVAAAIVSREAAR